MYSKCLLNFSKNSHPPPPFIKIFRDFPPPFIWNLRVLSFLQGVKSNVRPNTRSQARPPVKPRSKSPPPTMRKVRKWIYERYLTCFLLFLYFLFFWVFFRYRKKQTRSILKVATFPVVAALDIKLVCLILPGRGS